VGIELKMRLMSMLLRLLATLFFFVTAPAFAATCSQAGSQGTAPSTWQTYCWLDFATYNDTTARTFAGQNFSYTLSDGATLTFTVKASGSAATSIAAPSWTGAAVGNSAFLSIPGKPILYQTVGGIATPTTITISNILITPPAGSSAVTAYAFVAADAESTDNNESLSFTTNGSPWTVLDQVDPISGSSYPTTTGAGTSTFTANGGGVTGNTGAWIVGSNSPTTVSAVLTGSGLQGAMFAVRFASLRLNKQIVGARVAAADQFKFDIKSTSSGSILATGTSAGTSLGPFTAAAVSLASGIPLTISEAMAAGSTSSLSRYSPKLSCTNGSTGSATVLPTNVTTTSFNFGALQFGDAIQCTFTNTPFPHISLAKALSGTRFFAGDQFTVQINQGAAPIASATSTGTGSTITGGSTGQTQLIAATPYTLSEIAASGSLSQYTSAMACTNAFAASTTTLTTVVGGTITPKLGDVITCTITNTKRPNNGTLTMVKFSQVISDPINGTSNPKMIPGAVVRYSLIVANTGNQAITSNSIILIDPLPTAFTYNAASLVQFANGTTTSGLSAFNPATMVTFSSAAGGGTPFTYSPVTSGFDTNVKGIRIAPAGTMAAATAAGQPSFTVSFLGRIN
jgi:uncharacterized repeat protein (TIGR01451 family)